MRKFIYVAFTAALISGSLPLFAQDKGDAAKGKEVFDQCAGCHNADSTEKKMGPGLKGLFAKDKMHNGSKPTYDNVLKQVNEGGNGMPGYKDLLSDDEKKNLMAYLQTL
jgi:cytochrome c2